MTNYTKKLFCLIASLAFLTQMGGKLFAVPLSPQALENQKRLGVFSLTKKRLESYEAKNPGLNNRTKCIEMLSKVESPKTIKKLSDKGAIIGTYKALVLLVDFQDNTQATNKNHYENLLFNSATSTFSMRDFYLENSYNQLDIKGDVYGWYRAPHPYAYYVDNQNGFGTYPKNVQKLVEDVVAAADKGGVDFSQYDNDKNGYVDCLFIVHAGTGAEEDGSKNKIWSHMWATKSPISVDGVKVYIYSMEPEDGKVGVFSHELGHVFGLPDLYDYGYDSKGVGYWSVMAGGSWLGPSNNEGSNPAHFDAWSKIQLGWVNPVVLFENTEDAQIPVVETNKTIYKLWKYGQPYREYFLVENRQKQAGKFDAYLPGGGLLIWHIDDSIPNNNDQTHYKVALEQADGNKDLEHNSNHGDAGDPFPGSTNNTEFSDTTTPNSKAYDRSVTYIALKNISASSATMTADVYIAPEQITYYKVSGYVKESSGKGIQGVSVYAISTTTVVYTTNSDGYYEFYLTIGSYTIKPEKSGWNFSPPSYSFTPLTSNQSDQDFTATAVSIYQISGYVKEANGNAMANILIKLEGDTSSSTYTTSNGYYEFTVSPGNYEVKPSSSNLVFTPEAYYYYPLNGNKSNQDFTAELNVGTITGNITDQNNNPVAGAYVYLSSWNYTTTDSSGNYTFTSVLAGTYKLEANPPYNSDLLSARVTLTLAGGKTLTQDIQLELGGKITGRVTDKAGNAVVNASLSASDLSVDFGGGNAYTDSDGNYTIKRLNTGIYQIWVNSPDKSTLVNIKVEGISVTKGQTTTKDFVLEEGGKISGRVVDSSGNPTAAYLSANDWQTGGYGWARTTDGTYTIGKLVSGNYTVWVNPDNSEYVRVRLENISVTIGQETPNVNFILKRGGKISGYVKDAAGKPVDNASIWASDWYAGGYGYASTGLNGYYEIKGLVSGSYWVSVSPSSDSDLARKTTKDVAVTEEQTTTLDFILEVGGIIEGTVTDVTGIPVSGADISCGDYMVGGWGHGYTDVNGYYRIKGLPTGVNYHVSVRPSSGSDLAGKSVDGISIVVSQTTTLNFSLPIGGKLTGIVTDTSGIPVVNAEVSTYGRDEYGSAHPKEISDRREFLQHIQSLSSLMRIEQLNKEISKDKSAQLNTGLQKFILSNAISEPKRSYWGYGHTNSKGEYIIRGFDTGKYEVRVSPPKISELAKKTVRDVVITLGQTTKQDFILETGGKITGRVTDSDGKPVVRAQIYVEASDWRLGIWEYTYTDSNGNYTVKRLPTGSYNVRVEPPERSDLAQQSAKNISVTAPQATRQDFTLTIGGRISGRVTDEKDNSIEGAWVEAYNPTLDVSEGATTGSNGYYLISGLPIGEYTLRVEKWDSDYARERIKGIKVTAGQTTQQNVKLKIGGKISGTVKDENGIPISGVDVDAWTTFGCEGWGHASTDSKGKYEIKGLVSGNYNVEAYPKDVNLAIQRKYNISVELEKTAFVDFTLPKAGRIKGNVDMTNLPKDNDYWYGVVAFKSPVRFDVNTLFNDLMESPVGCEHLGSNGNYTITRLAPDRYDILPYLDYEGYGGTSPEAKLSSTAEPSNLRKIIWERLTSKPVKTDAQKFPGNYEWWITLLGIKSGISVGAGKETTVETITPNIGTGIISGKVSTADGGAIYSEDMWPLVALIDSSGMLVGFTVPESTTESTNIYTPTSGIYKIGNLPAGKYTAVAILSGYAPATKVVNIGDGAQTVDFVLYRGTTISGKVTFGVNVPINGATVRLKGTNVDKSVTTNQNGEYNISGIAKGSYELSASSQGYGTSKQDITVEANKSYKIDFVLKPAGNISGRVLLKNKPHEGALVIAVPSDFATIDYVTTDSQGIYRFTGLNFGKYYLAAIVEGYKAEKKKTEIIRDSPYATVDFELVEKEIKFTFGIYQISQPRGVIITVKPDTTLSGGLKYRFTRENGDVAQEGTQTTAAEKYSLTLLSEEIPSTELITLTVSGRSAISETIPEGIDSFTFQFATEIGVEEVINEVAGGKVEMRDAGEGKTDKTTVEICPFSIGTTTTGPVRVKLVKSDPPKEIKAKAVSKVYEIRLENAQLLSTGKIKLTLAYSGENIEDPQTLTIYYFNYASGQWEELKGATIDLINQTVNVTLTGELMTFSKTTSSDRMSKLSLSKTDGSGKYVVMQKKAQEAYPGTELITFNYPNPFNPKVDGETTIHAKIPGSGGFVNVELKIFNIVGELVYSHSFTKESGKVYDDIKWNGKNNSQETVSSGIYIYMLKAGDKKAFNKIAIIK